MEMGTPCAFDIHLHSRLAAAETGETQTDAVRVRVRVRD
jgi:hypothetical protein